MPALPSTRARDWKAWTLVAAVGLMLVIESLPSPSPLQRQGNTIPLTPNGQSCLAITVFAVILWISEALPFAATSLLTVLLVPAFGIADFQTVVRAGFGDPAIAFFIGTLIMSSAFTRSGLGTRLVSRLLLVVGTRTDRVLLGVLGGGAFISLWIPDIAVAAMLLPIGVGLLRDAGLQPKQSEFGRALMIATAFGALIGGIGTPAGTAANLVAIAQLKQLANVQISFARWTLYGAPAACLMVPLAWRLLLWLFPPELPALPMTADDIRRRLRELGPPSAAEWRTLAVFAVVIATWLVTPLVSRWTAGRIAPPIESVALAGGLALFLPGLRVLTWKEAERDIEWGGIMLIVAGLSLGLAVYESGAARWLAWVLLGNISAVPDLLRPFVIVLAVAAFHLLFSSNTVTASVIIPILIALAKDLQLDAWTIVAPAGFTSSLAFILVSEGPTTIIPYSSGYFTIRDMAKAGVWMTLAAAVCVTVSVAVVRLAFP